MADNDTSAQRDEAYQPETGESKVWLEMIAEAEKVFRQYQTKSDAIDKLYADLDRLSNIARDREFQLFWANMEVMKPSIYSRPPVPVVVPKFKDRRPLYRVSSELLERSTAVAFDLADINSTMIMLRDDVAIVSRGAPWVRYETQAESDGPTEKICIEHCNRKDFLHEPARNWSEVGWVAKRSWMTLDEMRKRFKPTSGDAYLQASTQVMRKDNQRGGATRQEKAPVWEIWSKTENKVVWVCEGVDTTLDEGKPHLKLRRFFPCPKPAYATTQRSSLVPVPEMLLYKDQLEEIGQLTNRIHALSEAIKIKAFVPGGGEIGDAIEAAINLNDDRKITIPIANWAAFGGGDSKIIFMPIEQIAATVAGLVELRRAVIDDVYQIMGLSDIMRGSTEKDETLGAQQLKAQFGSVRIRDKQAELVRVAKEVVEIVAEIMAENFDKETLLDMSQMEIATDADIAKQVKALEMRGKQLQAAMERAQQDPQTQQQAQQNPEQAQQIMQQVQGQMQQISGQIAKLKETVTIEQVMKFLRDNKIRPFALDIETDSTIQPDEQAEKASRKEFMEALGAMIAQFSPVIQAMPAMAPMVGELIKFALAPYRVGRELEGKIDEAIEAMVSKGQEQQPNPEAEAAKAQQAAEQQRLQMEVERAKAEQEARQNEAMIKQKVAEEDQRRKQEAAMHERDIRDRESAERLRSIEIERTLKAEKHNQDIDLGALDIRKKELEIERLGGQIFADAQKAEIAVDQAEMQAVHSSQSFEQQTAINEQKAKGSDE